MTRAGCHRLRRLRFGWSSSASIAVVLALVALLGTASWAHAHGPDGDAPVWERRPLDPYEVSLWADLHVPSTLVYARVEVGGAAAPEGTRVRLNAQGPDGQRMDATAERIAGAAGSAGDFEALLPVPGEGEWTVTVQIDGPAGAAEDNFVRTARPESSEQWARGPFLVATVLVIVLAAAVGVWWMRQPSP